MSVSNYQYKDVPAEVQRRLRLGTQVVNYRGLTYFVAPGDTYRDAYPGPERDQPRLTISRRLTGPYTGEEVLWVVGFASAYVQGPISARIHNTTLDAVPEFVRMSILAGEQVVSYENKYWFLCPNAANNFRQIQLATEAIVDIPSEVLPPSVYTHYNLSLIHI